MKNLTNTRMLKQNGSWIYCTGCNKTVAYLCYSTYHYFKFTFDCKCGGKGELEIGDDGMDVSVSKKRLIVKAARRCCPNDSAALFSPVDKNLVQYSCFVVCKSCGEAFEESWTLPQG